MAPTWLTTRFDHLKRALVDFLTERREIHGLATSMYLEGARLEPHKLWPKLEAALNLIAEHDPAWVRRMRQMNNSIHIRRIPGTRARLMNETETILDPYLLADFLPAQIAASIVHEATHARIRYYGVPFRREDLPHEERVCRRSELRLGERLERAGVAGARSVIERATAALLAKDEAVGVAVNWNDLEILATVTRIKDSRLPSWLKRLVARQHGVLDTPEGRAAFGDSGRGVL